MKIMQTNLLLGREVQPIKNCNTMRPRTHHSSNQKQQHFAAAQNRKMPLTLFCKLTYTMKYRIKHNKFNLTLTAKLIPSIDKHSYE